MEREIQREISEHLVCSSIVFCYLIYSSIFSFLVVVVSDVFILRLEDAILHYAISRVILVREKHFQKRAKACGKLKMIIGRMLLDRLT